MITREFRIAVVLAVTALAIKACATSGGIQADTYACNDLQQLVAEQQQVTLSGFLGTVSVYASANSCDSILDRPIPVAWRTTDVFSCVVGYRCEEVIGKEGPGGGQ